MPPASRIILAGVGLLTPLGHSAWQTFTALLAGRSFTDRAAALPSAIAPVDLIRALGCVSVTPHAGTDPAIELADRAAREALLEAGIGERDETCPIFLGTSKGAIATFQPSAAEAQPVSPQRRVTLASSRPAPVHALALGPHAYLAAELQRRLGMPVLSHVVAACASSLVALHHARQHLLHDRSHDRVLVLTSEAALTPLFIHSYDRLGVLAPLTTTDYRSRPLDERRTGFALAEQAAAVVLKRVDTPPAPGEIEILDTRIGSESFDIVRPAPRMTALEQLARDLVGDFPVDMIHPHAPGTPDHDPAELAAYAALFTSPGGARPPLASSRTPDVYACKGAIGHGLGAAGLAALVLACLIARTGRRPPMPWLAQPIQVEPFKLSAAPNPVRERRTHAVFAAGFAGHLAGALIHRC